MEAKEKNVVLTASVVPSKQVCGYRNPEPWLRLPKSALITYYPLSNGQLLAVANIHAINFSLSLTQYRHQLSQLVVQLKKHNGPIIFAGDFNSWSSERLKQLDKLKEQLNLKEVKYQNDQLRKRFITGDPLDHVFYRGLFVISAVVQPTKASDHNPILVSFKTTEPLK